MDSELLGRTLSFKNGTLPGQPAAMHVGTHELVSDLIKAVRAADATIAAQAAEIERLRDSQEMAWVVIANAPGWDDPQYAIWRDAAIRWREAYHAYLDTLAPEHVLHSVQQIRTEQGARLPSREEE